MRHIFYDSLKRFFVACALTVVGIFSATAANLPAGYTELEYIQTDGNSWINTGLKGHMNYTYELSFQQVDAQSYRNWGVFGQQAWQGKNMSLTWSSGFAVRWSSSASGTQFVDSLGAVDTNPHVLRIVNGEVYWDGVDKGKSEGHSNDFVIQYNLFLGTINPADTTPTSNARSKYYYYKVWDNNGNLIQDFVPAKNSSGVIGMYDTVNNVFYTNQGTGTFTAGPIACNGTRVNYTTATGTVTQNGTPTPTNPIEPVFYQQGDMVLRKVGDVADSYDATTGKITRRVGVVTLNGTEDWKEDTTSFYLDGDYNGTTGNQQSSSHYKYNGDQSADSLRKKNQAFYLWSGGNRLRIRDTTVGSLTDFTDFLAAQYTAGTPVTVYYLLATATEEDWVAEQCENGNLIKIATTKYTEDAFAGLMTTLSEAITKVTNIVDTTVQQATEIGNLATTKQDRPDTDCPAGRKCLLIMGADNKPHWYLIQE